MSTAPTIDLLECMVARAHIGLPRAAVAQLIEYDLAPLPSPAQYVGGLGVHDGRVVVSVALTPALGQQARTTRGVLLTVPGATSWCVEVSSVGGFVPAELGDDGEPDSDRPRWLRRARLRSGKAVIAVDVDAMVTWLTEGGSRGR